jgi:pimeloyl-ACP methyl ester carboxylesterase
MGCQVAVDMAARHPQRVDRMVLTGPTVDPVQRTWRERAWRFFVAGFYEKVSLKWYVLTDYSRMGRRVFAEARYACEDKIETKLPYVAAPTLLVRGEHDTIVPQRWLEEATRMLPYGWNQVIANWGHAVNYSAAPELVAAIRPFLSASDPRSFRSMMPVESEPLETAEPRAIVGLS